MTRLAGRKEENQVESSLNFWKFIAGLGFFLYGMRQLELSVHELIGKKFKLFLKKYTTNRLFAILNGFFAASILQSSAIVLLLVIAFAGAGIISLSNSLGIILGANLGTTVTGWLVSAIGFKINAQSFIYPMIGIGSLGLIFVSRRVLFYHLFGFIISVGFLFMGLDFMKQSFAHLATVVDIRQLSGFGFWAYISLGFLVTAAIQSSSAMMSITLSALYSNIIPLEAAVFIVIGADFGTTMTALLGSIKGTAVKKRVGLAHFFFNLGTAVLALLIMQPLLLAIQNILKITDPLYSLVAFHSGFNFVGVILFLPFLGLFEKFLNRFFINHVEKASLFIQKVDVNVPEASIEAVRLELQNFAKKVFMFNVDLIGFKIIKKQNEQNNRFKFFQIFLSDEDVFEDYKQIKKIEEELLEYFRELQKEKLDADESEALNHYILALRNGVQSAKAIKDIRHNLKELQQSAIEVDEYLIEKIHKVYQPVYQRIDKVLQINDQKLQLEELAQISIDNEKAYHVVNEWIYNAAQETSKTNIQVATFLNVNREIYNATWLFVDLLKNILLLLKDI